MFSLSFYANSRGCTWSQRRSPCILSGFRRRSQWGQCGHPWHVRFQRAVCENEGQLCCLVQRSFCPEWIQSTEGRLLGSDAGLRSWKQSQRFVGRRTPSDGRALQPQPILRLQMDRPICQGVQEGWPAFQFSQVWLREDGGFSYFSGRQRVDGRWVGRLRPCCRSKRAAGWWCSVGSAATNSINFDPWKRKPGLSDQSRVDQF